MAITVNTIVTVYTAYISILLTTAEAAISKGDSLDIYMKSVKDKLDKGTMHEIKLQVNKLKKVPNYRIYHYMHMYIICIYCSSEIV